MPVEFKEELHQGLGPQQPGARDRLQMSSCWTRDAQSGIVSELIYYADSCAFYEKFEY